MSRPGFYRVIVTVDEHKKMWFARIHKPDEAVCSAAGISCANVINRLREALGEITKDPTHASKVELRLVFEVPEHKRIRELNVQRERVEKEVAQLGQNARHLATKLLSQGYYEHDVATMLGTSLSSLQGLLRSR